MISKTLLLVNGRHFAQQFDALAGLTNDEWLKLAFKAESSDNLSLELLFEVTTPAEWLFMMIPGETLGFWIDFVDFITNCFDCALRDQRSLVG